MEVINRDVVRRQRVPLTFQWSSDCRDQPPTIILKKEPHTWVPIRLISGMWNNGIPRALSGNCERLVFL